MFPHQNDGQIVRSLANIARTVKFGEQFLSCNGLREYCMGANIECWKNLQE
jgi:hypothetical protein